MSGLLTRFATLLLLLAGALPAAAQIQLPAGGHVDASLVAETEAAFPGQSLWVALRLQHDDNWHTYWKNPGDAGKPTEIDWRLPEGVSAGGIVWPIPERFELPADLVDFGYEGEIFLLTRLDIPEDFAADTFEAAADVRWLECEEICIPGNASVSLELPVTAEGPAPLDARWREGFAETRAGQPRGDVALDAMYSIVDGGIHLLVQATEPVFEDARDVTFLPGQHRVFDYNAEQEISWQLSSLQLAQDHHRRVLSEPPEVLEGLLVVDEGGGRRTAYEVMAQPEGVDVGALGGVLPISPAGQGGASMNIFVVFAFAMLGGIILNLMPCVFPVLSLKALSLTASSGSALRHQRLHGLAYAAGVIGAFLVLAAVLLSLQAGGAAVGWGFHLQSPWFVAALVYLFFLMGLAMSGVIEFGAGIMGTGSHLAEEHSYRGSFFTGVLASVVASPCTAPFMGAALGFAFTQSMPVALAVFVALGFGMALPFLLFSFVPALARLLPRPGRWMLTFKQLLAFPLYATAAWLLWVLGRQTGPDAMALVIASCVLLGLAAWLYHWRQSGGGAWRRYAGILLILLCLVPALAVLRSPFLETRASTAQAAAEDAAFETFTQARLAALRAEGRPVFVNMTASWCITCLVNERVALSSDTVLDAMQANGVTYLKGDWTNNDPEITAVLKEYNTSGVPLYLLFPAGPNAPAQVLPQILTESIILDALERI